jgi:hypothetical protein
MSEKTDEAKLTATALSRFVNSYGNKVEDLVQHVAMDHRTLQQGVTRFCVAWLAECAKMQQTGNFDLRNEASVKLGKAVMEKTTPQERALPFI